MQCSKCGWNNTDDATQCANCQADLTQPAQPQQPQQFQQPQPVQTPYAAPPRPAANYMIWSVINTVLAVPFCNVVTLVLGIIAIVKSSSANNRNTAGDYAGAQSEATTAMVLNIIATAALVLFSPISVMFWIGFISGLSQFQHMPNFPR